MTLILANNVSTTLLGNIGPTDAAIAVAGGKGALFPNPAAGTSFLATIEDTAGNVEIVECTGRAVDVLTVIRGREGTLARAFSAGDVVEMRFTAGMLNAIDWRTSAGSPNSPALLDDDGALPITQYQATLTVFGDSRWMAKTNYTYVQNGTGVNQLSNVVKIGWKAGGKLGLTVDATDIGNIATESWASTSFLPASYTPTWGAIAGKPGTFPPSAHGHPISDVSGLGSALGSKLDIYGGTIYGGLTVTGALSGSTVTETSDARIKERPRTMSGDDALSIVGELRPVRYFNKRTERWDFGFLADEARFCVPELVVEGPEMIDGEPVLSLAYGRLAAPLAAALIALLRRVEELEKR